MKHFIFLIFLSFVAGSSIGQVKAVTETGKEVYLYEDGTWEYINDSSSAVTSTSETPLNKQKFSKAANASFMVKSKVVNVGVAINPNKWTFKGHKENETNPEYMFAAKGSISYAMMITEGISVDLENMRDIAILNAQRASTDIKETMAEYRMVNDKKVLCLEFKATVKGLKFTYLGYYFSNEKGTVQLLAYTSSDQYPKVKGELVEFLNGLTELKQDQ